MRVGLVLAFGGVLWSWASNAARAREQAGQKKEMSKAGEGRKDTEGYLAAKEMAFKLAARIATDRLHKVTNAYLAAEEIDTLAKDYKELLAVAQDAWPVLRDEWKRVIALPKGPERRKRLKVLVYCFSSTYEERALGLLAEYALAEKRREVVPSVEGISGVGHMMLSEMTAEDLRAYDERFAKWWKKYKPGWKGRMGMREEREASLLRDLRRK